MAKNAVISLLFGTSLFGDLGGDGLETCAAALIDPGKLRGNARRVDA